MKRDIEINNFIDIFDVETSTRQRIACVGARDAATSSMSLANAGTSRVHRAPVVMGMRSIDIIYHYAAARAMCNAFLTAAQVTLHDKCIKQ